MSKHKQVVTDTIKFLYDRITAPTASDRERRRIALLAAEQIEPTPSKFSMEGSTIAQVQTAVEAGDIGVDEALAFEVGHDNRKTLVSWLEERS